MTKINAIRMLNIRLKHQQGEVDEAKRKLGQLGFTKAYLKRMVSNVEQTKRMIKNLKK